MKLYTLENEYLKVKLLDYGATLVSLVVKQKNVDVVLGFDELDKYQNEGKYIGQTIGRVCNRIAKGQYHLNGKKYTCKVNNGPNSLHGGEFGFDTKEFKVESIEDGYLMTYTSPDNEEGYQGELVLAVEYKLVDKGLDVTFKANTTKDTICSITNHAFFNLNGTGSILNHKVWIDADYIGEVDEDGLTLPRLMEVTGTPFDFRRAIEVGYRIEEKHSQLLNGNGYDHNYVFNKDGYKLKASLEANNILMNVYTDYMNMHLYSGNYLENQVGKNGEVYHPRNGICFETQLYPNAINYPCFIQPILRKEDTYLHKTRFEFIVK